MSVDVMTNQPVTNGEVAGFWSRLIAFLIDMTLLSIVLHAVGILFYDYFSSIGQLGRLVGFMCVMIYFGLLNSHSQTLGKRLLKIRVVDADGNKISYIRSFIRTSILVIPYLLSGFNLLGSETSYVGIILLGIVVFGGLSGVLYYYIFNYKNRRSLHDFIVKTYVVTATSNGSQFPPNTSWIHQGYAGVVVVIVSFLLYINLGAYSQGTIKELKTIQAAVLSEEAVRDAETWFSTVSSGNSAFSYVNIIITPRVPTSKIQEQLPEMYTRLKTKAPFIIKYEALQFTLMSGYDLGFAHISSGTRVFYKIAEWDSISTISLKELH